MRESCHCRGAVRGCYVNQSGVFVAASGFRALGVLNLGASGPVLSGGLRPTV